MASKFVVVCALTAACGAARADLIDLNLQDTPKIVSISSDVTYNAGDDALFVTGDAMQLTDEGGMSALDATFFLAGTIDASGNPVSGGLLITPNSSSRGISPLLSGLLTGFGFENGGGTLLQFRFMVVGGTLADEYGGIGADFGVIMDSGLAYSGDWTADFNNFTDGEQGSGEGTSQTSPVAPSIPAPASGLVFGLAGLGCARRRR